MFQYTVNKDISLENREPTGPYGRNQYDASESSDKRNSPFQPHSMIRLPLRPEYSFPTYDSAHRILTANHNGTEGSIQDVPLMASTSKPKARSRGSSDASSESSTNCDEGDIVNIPCGDYYEDIKINDRDMSQIPTKEFNKIVKKSRCDKERTAWLKQRRRTLKNRGYASSCRENREHEQNGKQLEIAEKTNKLMEKRARLAEQRKQQIDLISLYRKTFRRVESYHNLHCSKEKYSISNDIDIEEDLFDSDSTDHEKDDNDDTIITTIVA